MGYDINDTNTGNLWASCLTEQEAPAEVQRAVTESGEHAIASWALGRNDHVGAALFGKALIAQAMRPVTARPR